MKNLINKIVLIPVFIIPLCFSCSKQNQVSTDFAAFYTNHGEKDGITGEYADVVVRFPDGKLLIFSRESSYLPYLLIGSEKWFVDERVTRKGDGQGIKPDKLNRYSYVRIIKNTPEKIVVHWRYIPDFNNPGFTGVVHEIYSIQPDGKMQRTVRPGNLKVDEFNNPENWMVEELALNQSGIRQISIKKPNPLKSALPATKGAPVIAESVAAPVLWWTFDDGMQQRSYDQKNVTVEKIQGIQCPIGGNISLFKKGVSGTALAFDGYFSNVLLKNAAPAEQPKSYSLEAWIALGAYPWAEGAVLDMTDEKGGVYLGITDSGQLRFTLYGKEREHILTSKEEIPLYKWTHIAATYDLGQNKTFIYVNGKLAGEGDLGNDELTLKETDLSIGLNKTAKRGNHHVSRDYPPDVRTPEGNQPMIYGIEGLIDELKIYDQLLNPDQINKSYKMITKNIAEMQLADLEPRILPGDVDGKNAGHFGAYYTNLKYHDLWDNLWRSSDWPDIVVRFDELPCSVVYWRGPNYGPGWVTENNIWMCDQSAEIGTYYGCAEHMADKQNRFSHVRLLENTEARVVVHWRYASVDIMYQFDNDKTWTDEYHYIYPDGSAVRSVHYYDGEVGWQDVQFFTEAGSTPEEKINLQALTVANLAGETYKMDWSMGIPANKLENACVSVINFKSDYKVYVAYPDGSEIGAWGEQERATPQTHFAGPWNHWPVSQMPNDGRYAMRNDRVTHSALGGASPEAFALYGFTNQDITTLLPMARFWNYPPALTVTAGADLTGYAQSQKAYILKKSGPAIRMTFAASAKSPLCNPSLVIEGVQKKEIKLEIEDRLVTRDDAFRYGFVPTEAGYNLVIWLKLSSEKPVSLNISL